MSVTDISQKCEKKKTLLLLKPLSNVPFLYQCCLPPLPQDITHSLVWFSQFTLGRMQYLTEFSKPKKQNKKKTAEISHLCSKKAAFALVRLPRQGNKHSYNLLRSTAIDRRRPCVGKPGSQKQWKPGSPESVSAHQRALLKCFLEKNRRGIHLLVKIHNPKLPKC